MDHTILPKNQLGLACLDLEKKLLCFELDFDNTEKNNVRCPDLDVAKEMEELILKVISIKQKIITTFQIFMCFIYIKIL